MTKRDRQIADAAERLAQFWRNYSTERLHQVIGDHTNLAVTIEGLCELIESQPRVAVCDECGKRVQLTPAGYPRQHTGDVFVGGWAQHCTGSNVLASDGAS